MKEIVLIYLFNEVILVCKTPKVENGNQIVFDFRKVQFIQQEFNNQKFLNNLNNNLVKKPSKLTFITNY